MPGSRTCRTNFCKNSRMLFWNEPRRWLQFAPPGRLRIALVWAVWALCAYCPLAVAQVPATPAAGAAGAASIKGTLRDAKGDPVGEALVSLTEMESGQPHLLQAKTGADGSFVLEPSHAGTYSLKAQKGAAEALVQKLVLAPAEQKRVDLVLRGKSAPLLPASEAGAMEFDDKPSFTVAGVIDSTAAGGHGSGEGLRTSEALAEDTAKLKSGEPPPSGDLTQTRERLSGQIESSGGGPTSAKLHRQLGDVYERLGDSLAAVREFEMAARLAPVEENYFEWGAELLLHRAIVPAIEVFRKGVTASPSSARMQAGLGAALYASGAAEDAAQQICAASDLAPTDAAPYYFLGKMQLASPTALACIEPKLARLVHLHPGDALGNYYYAIAIWRGEKGDGELPQWQTALALTEKAAALNPKLGEAYLLTGILQSARHHDKAALAAFQQAIETTPNLAEAHYRLANLYKQMGEPAKAQLSLQQYKSIQKTEAAEAERKRVDLQQFVVILKDQPATGDSR